MRLLLTTKSLQYTFSVVRLSFLSLFSHLAQDGEVAVWGSYYLENRMETLIRNHSLRSTINFTARKVLTFMVTKPICNRQGLLLYIKNCNTNRRHLKSIKCQSLMYKAIPISSLCKITIIKNFFSNHHFKEKLTLTLMRLACQWYSHRIMVIVPM